MKQCPMCHSEVPDQLEFEESGLSQVPAQCGCSPDGQIKAEIQLVGLISAIKGFTVTKPDITVVKLDSMLKTILSFSRSALDEDQENAGGQAR